MKEAKPLGIKNYGSIPHLPGSRQGPSEHHISEGQLRIATEKARDWKDLIIVQEKLDGSNVGVAKINGEIVPLSRAGYHVNTSPYEQHHLFGVFVEMEKQRFKELLNEGERLVGEWMLMAHGTKYKLPHEPFVAFDLMTGIKRLPYHLFCKRVYRYDFITPHLLHIGQPLSMKSVKKLIGESYHGAEETEGAVFRIEREGQVDFLCKYVKPNKVDGLYLKDEIYNELPDKYNYLLQQINSRTV